MKSLVELLEVFRIRPLVQQFTCNREYEPECAANKVGTRTDHQDIPIYQR